MLLRICFFLMICDSLWPQCVTNVRGTISGTWTTAGSPYCVTADVQVGSLVVQPGVRVEFSGNFTFAVPGLLNAIGTAQAPIVFTKGSGVVGWQGMLFSFSRSGSELAYVQISGALNGGLRIDNTASPPVIRNSVFTGNSRSDAGGGIFITKSGKVTLTACLIESNTSVNLSNAFSSGGGIYSDGELTLIQTTVSANRAHFGGSTGGTKYARGGGVYSQGKLDLIRSIVQKNIVTTEGLNSALNGFGAGVYVRGEATIVNSVIAGNQGRADYTPTGFGGGSANQGAGIYVESASSRVDIINTTIYQNDTYGKYNDGGGLYTQPGSSVSLLDSIVWANTAPFALLERRDKDIQIFAGGTVTTSYSDIQGGLFAGPGNINLNPIFENAAADPMLHLALGSPAIDAGTCTGGARDDIDGEVRPSGQTCDIGADELAVKPPSIAGIYGSASGLAKGSPGSWISIFGAGFGIVTRSWTTKDFNGPVLPLGLDGVEVRVNGSRIPISFISPVQINAALPWGTVPGRVSVVVATTAGASAAFPLDIQALDPAFFRFEPENRRYPVAIHANGDLVGPRGMIPGIPSRPGRAGDIIVLYASGLGKVNPLPIDGEVISAPLQLAGQSFAVRVRGMTADVRFAGLVATGLYQINLVIPGVPAGDQPIGIESDGSSSPNAFLAVE